MIWILLIIATLLTLLFISAPLLRTSEQKRLSPVTATVGFAIFIAAALGIYALIGSPELTKSGALKPFEPPRGPTSEQMQAAQSMTPEERAEMILAMVDSLAARLEDNPNDPQGWVRLLRSRAVLDQNEQAQKDMLRIREVFKDTPEIAEDIIKAANPN